MFNIGADYILEGSTLLIFSGPTSSTWEWSFVASPTHAIAGTNAEFCFDLSRIGGVNSFDLIFWANNKPYGGSAIDSVPNNLSSGAYLTYINPDCDGDGIPDDWETAHGLNPIGDRDGDPDKNGCNNSCEYLAETDPLNGQSQQTFTAEPTPGTNVPRCRFQTSPHRLYAVEYHHDLVTDPWRELLPPFIGDGTEMIVPDPPPGSQRLYRLYRLRTTVP